MQTLANAHQDNSAQVAFLLLFDFQGPSNTGTNHILAGKPCALSCQAAQAMEAAGDIDIGAAKVLREEAKKLKTASMKAVSMLANALAPCVDLDVFRPSQLPGGVPERNALEHRPVLIMTGDEERKQTLGCFWIVAVWCAIPFIFFFGCSFPACFIALRVKWEHQLQYAVRIRSIKRRDFHHRSVNDAQLAIKDEGLWGRLAAMVRFASLSLQFVSSS